MYPLLSDIRQPVLIVLGSVRLSFSLPFAISNIYPLVAPVLWSIRIICLWNWSYENINTWTYKLSILAWQVLDTDFELWTCITQSVTPHNSILALSSFFHIIFLPLYHLLDFFFTFLLLLAESLSCIWFPSFNLCVFLAEFSKWIIKEIWCEKCLCSVFSFPLLRFQSQQFAFKFLITNDFKAEWYATDRPHCTVKQEKQNKNKKRRKYQKWTLRPL